MPHVKVTLEELQGMSREELHELTKPLGIYLDIQEDDPTKLVRQLRLLGF